MGLATVPRFKLDILLRTLPPTVSVIPEIKRFLPPASNMGASGIELVNGTVSYNLLLFPFNSDDHDRSYP